MLFLLLNYVLKGLMAEVPLVYIYFFKIYFFRPLSTIPQLQDLFGLYNNFVEKVSKKHIQTVVSKIQQASKLQLHEAKEVVEALLQWPILRVSDARLQDGLKECCLNICLFEEDINDNNETIIVADQEYKLRLKLELLGPNRVGFLFLKQKI